MHPTVEKNQQHHLDRQLGRWTKPNYNTYESYDGYRLCRERPGWAVYAPNGGRITRWGLVEGSVHAAKYAADQHRQLTTITVEAADEVARSGGIEPQNIRYAYTSNNVHAPCLAYVLPDDPDLDELASGLMGAYREHMPAIVSRCGPGIVWDAVSLIKTEPVEHDEHGPEGLCVAYFPNIRVES